MKKIIQIPLFMAVLFLPLGCAKEFLEVKRDKTQAIPSSLQDYLAMLDNISTFNTRSALQLNAVGTDEYYIEDQHWDLLSSNMQKNAYIWAKNIFEGEESDSWNFAYERILYANTVLDGLKDYDYTDVEESLYSTIYGSALFMRAYTFYQLAQTFAPQYDIQSSTTDLGIPLRLEMDITLPVKRATLENTYQQMTGDLELAVRLLPTKSTLKFRPTRQAAYALLSKIYLHKGDYESASNFADSCLTMSDGLLDYNTLDTKNRYTFADFQLGEGNPEVLYTELIPGQTVLNSSRFCINPEVYDLYEIKDIRKDAFFYPTRGTYTFKGSYTGMYNFFGGLALDEIVLIRAECRLRLADPEGALEDINYLLENRYEKGGFVPYFGDTYKDIMQKIIQERRKQLLCRAIRWEDLKRFNKETAFQTTLRRDLKGDTYLLQPNDPRYTWPIPDEVIWMSGIPQNVR